MNDHYYSKNPRAAHDRKQVQVTCRGVTMTFVTDAGVFSKNELDYGTRVLIEQIRLPEAGRIADIGCGYGAIGCFVARVEKRTLVTMVDINERAVQLAKENAAIHDLRNVRIVQSDGFEQLQGETFDLVVTNPPIRAGKAVIFNLYEQAYARLAEHGELWVVIQKKQGAPSTVTMLENHFSTVEVIVKQKGYWVICAKKN